MISGSSPLSFRMAQRTQSGDRWMFSTANASSMPLGVSRRMDSFLLPLSSIHAAALAAAAAQEPVV